MKGESPQLDDLIAAKDVIYANAGGKRNPSVKAYFVSLGTYEKNTRTEGLITDFVSTLKEMNIFDVDGVEVQMVGASALQRYYRAATSAVEVKFPFSENVVMPQNDSVEEAYIGYVPAEQLLKLVASYDENGNIVDINKSVLFDNIRDFDEDSEINQSVIETLERGEGKDFAFRNNGITVVAKSIHRTSNDFKIEDFQIVNGCQTSNIIFHARNHIADVSVPLRLIGSKDDNFVNSIIVGTNRQNTVREEQFWALKPFMKNFEEYYSSVNEEDRLYFERRENQFRGQAIEKVRVIVSSTLMKVITATLLQQPNRSSRDYRRIYADNKSRIFLDNHNVRVYHSACYLNYKLDFLWRNQKLGADLKIFRYYLLYAVSNFVSNGKNVLVMKKAEAERYADQMVALAKDESKLKALVESVAERVRGLIDVDSLNSREKMRDAIRPDTFFSRFETPTAQPEKTKGQ